MKNSRLLALGISLSITTALSTTLYAKKIYPAEIMGRDLNYPGLGWLGHVGVATASMSSVTGMTQNANLVIEVLNEPTVGQINSIANFKARSRYWGSKYGIADRGERGYHVLLEANHQRWWCPVYTSDTDYQIGEGNLYTGERMKCGRWRCDTFAWWAFYSQGWDTMPGRAWLPAILFNTFPYSNDKRIVSGKEQLKKTNLKRLDDITAEELNEMPIEEFQMLMNSPQAQVKNNFVAPQAAYMRLVHEENLNDAKRGIIIDRLTSRGSEPELVATLINLYRETKNIFIKEKVVSGLMIHYQHHLDLTKNTVEQQRLKNFFSDLLYEKLTPKAVDAAVRGFVDLHTSTEVMGNLSQIDKQIASVNHTSSIMLKYALVHKSKDFQPIYMKSIINELRAANDADLDSYLFGPLSIGYQGVGKGLLAPEAKQVVVDYLKEVRKKYTSKALKANPDDFYRRTTAPYYFELCKEMDI